MWEPPARVSTSYIVAVDPPAGWCIWGPGGIVVAGQADNIIKSWGQYVTARNKYLSGVWIYMAVVERPFGGQNTQSIIHNAIATGWWMREFHIMTHLQWNPMASQWRPHLGIGGARASLKAQAIEVARHVCRLQGIDPPTTVKGRPAEHASEAVCMALAAWLRFGLVVKDDIAHKFIKATGMPYEGGVKMGLAGNMALESGHAIRHMPFNKKKKIQPLAAPAQEKWYDDNPFEAGDINRGQGQDVEVTGGGNAPDPGGDTGAVKGDVRPASVKDGD